MNKFKIAKGFEDAFTERWSSRTSFLDESEGFMKFRLLRSQAAGTPHGRTAAEIPFTEFVSYSEWLDLRCFEKWMNGENSKRAHSSSAKKNGPIPEGMMMGPPEFRAFVPVLEQGYGHRMDYRSPLMDHSVESLFADERPDQRALFKAALEAGMPPINIGPLEGRILEILLRSTGAKRGVEIGTLGGYSASWLARALPKDGQLTTIEKDPKRADFARQHFEQMGLSGLIKVVTGEGLSVLNSMESLNNLDFVFIDADKGNYGNYVKWAIPRLRKGGLLLADNAYIWGGMNYFGQDSEALKYPAPGALDSFSKNDFVGMSECWQQLRHHDVMASIIVPTGEGLAVAVKI